MPRRNNDLSRKALASWILSHPDGRATINVPLALNGRNILHYLAEYGKLEFVRTLLELGAE